MNNSDNQYKLEAFQILTYHKTRYVIYGYGKWFGHVMDWLGMNIYHGRLPDSPVFASVNEAWTWLVKQVQSGTLNKGDYLDGHHAGTFECTRGCDYRLVSIKGFGDTIWYQQIKDTKKKRVIMQ